MIRTILYNPQTGEKKLGNETAFERWKDDPHSIIWCDFEGADKEKERTILKKHLAINELALDDCQATVLSQLAKWIAARMVILLF